jgi:hypothetical protein
VFKRAFVGFRDVVVNGIVPERFAGEGGHAFHGSVGAREGKAYPATMTKKSASWTDP